MKHHWCFCNEKCVKSLKTKENRGNRRPMYLKRTYSQIQMGTVGDNNKRNVIDQPDQQVYA